MNKRDIGRGGEGLAVNFIKEKGYKILETNFSCKLGEIDIIAKKGDVLCFIEVKLRKTKEFGSPLEAIDIRKKGRIFKTAQYYCMKNKIGDVPMRFDAVGIDFSSGLPVIEHVENAFS